MPGGVAGLNVALPDCLWDLDRLTAACAQHIYGHRILAAYWVLLEKEALINVLTVHTGLYTSPTQLWVSPLPIDTEVQWGPLEGSFS